MTATTSQPTATFLRLLQDDDKAAALAAAVATPEHPARFEIQPDTFRQVPGSPFAYWVSNKAILAFSAHSSLESDFCIARRTNGTTDDARWIRTTWEIANRLQSAKLKWIPHAKGGSYSPYYADLHLLIAWDEQEQTYPGYTGTVHRPDLRPASLNHFFRPGLTWPRRTNGLSFRILPAGCIFGDKGPGIFWKGDDQNSLLKLCAILNSSSFRFFVEMQLARVELAQSYEAGLVQQSPIPDLDKEDGLLALARSSVKIKQDMDATNETSHMFCFLRLSPASLHESAIDQDTVKSRGYENLSTNQREIDRIALELYGLTEDDIRIPEAPAPIAEEAEEGDAAEDDEDAADETAGTSPGALAAALVSYLVGCALGRWDIRYATGEKTPPLLPDPFAPLPACSPGMLTGDDGLPLRLPPAGYPLRVDADGILVDDVDHADDIVRRCREALEAILGERAEAWERDLCAALDVPDLRAYFRRPAKGGFWDEHVKRYSKSRRKAPIYWLLQSPKKHFGLWLYLHRLDPDTIHKALMTYTEPKLRKEQLRLEEIQAKRAAAGSPKEQRTFDRELDKQQAVVTDVQEFRDRLLRATQLNLRPDLNDGVVLTIAPLHELTPWKEPRKFWDELRSGKYPWSTIAQQLREKGLVKGV